VKGLKKGRKEKKEREKKKSIEWALSWGEIPGNQGTTGRALRTIETPLHHK